MERIRINKKLMILLVCLFIFKVLEFNLYSLSVSSGKQRFVFIAAEQTAEKRLQETRIAEKDSLKALVSKLGIFKYEVYLDKDAGFVFAEGKLFYFTKKAIKGFDYNEKDEANLLTYDDLFKQILEYEKQEYSREKAIKTALEQKGVAGLVKYSTNKNRVVAINALLTFLVKLGMEMDFSKLSIDEEIRQRLELRIKCIKKIFVSDSDRVNNILKEYLKQCEAFKKDKVKTVNCSSFQLESPPETTIDGFPYVVTVRKSSVIDWQLSVPEYIRPVKRLGGFQLIDRRANSIGFIDKIRGKIYKGGRCTHDSCMTVEEHRRYIEQKTEKLVLYDINYENLFQNGHVVSWKDGVIHVPLSDLWDYEESVSIEDKTYSSLVFWKTGTITGEYVKYKDVYFDEENKCYKGRLFVKKQEDTWEDKSGDIVFTVYGPAVMMHGSCLGTAGIEEQLKAGEFQDLRHVFNFPKIRKQESFLSGIREHIEGMEYYFGVQMLTDDDYMLAEKAYKESIELDLKISYYNKEKGEIIEEEFLIDDFRRILQVDYNDNCKYKEIIDRDVVLKQGQFRVVHGGKKIEIRLLHNYYPQMLVGVNKEGELQTVYLTGTSGTRGVKVEEAQKIAKKLDFHSAFLVVNGGGVKFDVGRKPVLPPLLGRISGASNLFLMADVSIAGLTEEELEQLYLRLDYEQFAGYMDFIECNSEVIKKSA
jgi:hypothetical protein